jgi:hypothetical protein
VVQGWFWAKLGLKIGNGPQRSTIFVANDSPRDINKQESTTLILPYDASNKHHCRDKKEFHWLCAVMQGWFWANHGSKIRNGPQQSAQFLRPLTAPVT